MNHPLTPEMRDWCKKIRTNPRPLSEAIPMMQRAADELDRLNAVVFKPVEDTTT